MAITNRDRGGKALERRRPWIRRPVLLALLVLTAAGLVGSGIYYWPQRYLHAAHAALKRRAYDSARASLRRYLEVRPGNAEAHLLLAQLDRRANNYADAARHLDACQRLGGSADALELERALGLIQQGIYNAELDALCSKHLAREDADQYLILEALSQGLTKTYRLNEALVCLNRMLVLQPDSTYALRRRAWIYTQGEEHDRAEADYRRALEIDPEDTVARLGLAQILLSARKNGRQAAEHFERLWAARQDATVALGLAQSWRLVGRLEDARHLLDDWLSSHPGDALALAERGQLALNEQATEEAVTLLRRAVALSPYLFDAHYALYLGLTRLGRTTEAKESRVRMEQAKKQAKKDKEEMAVLTQRLQQAPDDVDLRCQIAQIFLRYGEEEGLRWLLLNVQNYPNHRPSHLALADYYDKQGQPARAVEHRRLAGAAAKGMHGATVP
jgi:tetratricopeptide (TPR) repeat protein